MKFEPAHSVVCTQTQEALTSDEVAGRTGSFPPERRRLRVDRHAARQNDLLRASLAKMLSRSGRYLVVSNMPVPVTDQARQLVRRARGRYLGLSLTADGEAASGDVVVDMVVVDAVQGWAGAYAFRWKGAQSPLVRRHAETDLRSVELVLKSYLRSCGHPISTVTVGIVDGGADPEQADDLTISLPEIEYHFDLPFGAPFA
jgi:hypothetical protein